MRVIITVPIMSVLISSSIALCEIPSRLEHGYAEAVLAYNSREFDKSLRLLEDLLKEKPDAAEFLELKALNMKASKNMAGSADVYRKLIKAKLTEGAARKDVAPYFFELGSMSFKTSDFKQARPYFQESLSRGFNTAPSHFYLGIMDFRDEKWGEAEKHFKGVINSDMNDLKPAANLYLAQVCAKTDYPAGATQGFFAARSLAKARLDDKKTSNESRKVAQEIYDTADRSLKPFDQSRFFGNISLVGGYDSNVLSAPESSSSTSSSSGGTGKSSAKNTTKAGIGYMSSPLGAFQFVPSYRGSWNYNFNRDTRAGEFMSHDLSVYATRNVLSPTSYGMKFEGIYTFQNQVDPSTDKGKLRPYSLEASVGPYVKHEISPKFTLQADLFLQPRKNYLDSDSTSTMQKSGTEYLAKLTARNDKGHGFLNPLGYVRGSLNNTKGSEYYSRSVELALSDAMHFSEATDLLLTADLAFAQYPNRPVVKRNDRTLSFDANMTHTFWTKYSLLADIQYIKNSSNVADMYSFNRIVVSLGVGYAL